MNYLNSIIGSGIIGKQSNLQTYFHSSCMYVTVGQVSLDFCGKIQIFSRLYSFELRIHFCYKYSIEIFGKIFNRVFEQKFDIYPQCVLCKVLTSYSSFSFIICQLGMPYAFRSAGPGLGILIIVFSALITDYSCVLMIKGGELSKSMSYQVNYLSNLQNSLALQDFFYLGNGARSFWTSRILYFVSIAIRLPIFDHDQLQCCSWRYSDVCS